jgi:hypothetical protein
MKLFLISQGVNNGYDSFDSAVVAADSEEEAKTIHPISTWEFGSDDWSHSDCWAASPDQVDAEYIGEAAPSVEAGVILASFNAG